jgi:hypothetical protein
MRRDGDRAAAEFQRIIDHRGVEPFAPFYPLAHLGAARAAVLNDDAQKAARLYGEFFTLWAGADEDLPILREARAEYAKLNPQSPTAP